MYKPSKMLCKNYCKDYKTCNRTECERNLIFKADGSMLMVGPEHYNKIRLKERKRDYRDYSYRTVQ